MARTRAHARARDQKPAHSDSGAGDFAQTRLPRSIRTTVRRSTRTDGGDGGRGTAPPAEYGQQVQRVRKAAAGSVGRREPLAAAVATHGDRVGRIPVDALSNRRSAG